MQRVIVIGGGFAGLAAVHQLAGAGSHVDVVLIDPRRAHHFLPLLPDLVGRGLDPDALQYPFDNVARRWRCTHLQAEATGIDIERRVVATTAGEQSFDFLVIACGATTDFFDNHGAQAHALPLHSVDDALRIRQAMGDGKSVLVIGGGYTGVEIATNAKRLLVQRGMDASVWVADRASGLCASLPAPFQAYVDREVKALGIRVFPKTSLASLQGDMATLSDGTALENAHVIWTAGVKGCMILQSLPGDKDRQSRPRVDAYLRIAERCFVVGDAASVTLHGTIARMGVQFSITQGICAARNILRIMRNRAMSPYAAMDPGYVVPMAHGKACGSILGIRLFGRLPMWLHYVMCAARSYGVSNRYALVKGLFRSCIQSGAGAAHGRLDNDTQA